MDTIKIGKFLCELRKERNLAQEQLGEELGVSNKTVSRWETGTYLPPVEMLQLLSDKYNVSINEILSGERLADGEPYKAKAEENIKTALNKSVFTLSFNGDCGFGSNFLSSGYDCRFDFMYRLVRFYL